MRYFFYKTTCEVTGKYYLGVHSERRKSDGYIGCGVCSDGTALALKRKGVKSAFIDSVIKYGYKSFKREIVKEFESADKAYDYEKLVVNELLVSDKNCLNTRLGGIGGIVKNTCKPIEIVDCRTGEIKSFNSQADCASFLGLANISGKRRFLNNLYAIKGENIPISIKKCDNVVVSFHDIYQASEYTGLSIYDLTRLLSKQRKSCKGWFIGDFDFSSSFYKNAKKIRKGKY
jgi:hypothetical protein